MKTLVYYIISVCLLAGSTASAQNKWNITGDFSGDSFQKLVQEIESQTDYYFYYDSV